MAVKKGAINAFESQLATALKSAAITAAANLFTNNPEMTLEDFYAVMRPQGVTENITLSELHAALSGVVTLPVAVLSPAPARKPASFDQAAGRRRRVPNTPPTVSCQTREGQMAYHQSILEYLAIENWVRSPQIMEFCGGTAGQLGVAMRKYLIPGGLVKSKGKTIGLHFAVTAKGKQKAKSGTKVTLSTAQSRSRRGRPAPRGDADIGSDSRTLAARDAYRAAILTFMHGSKWVSGPEISKACGGGPARRKRAIRNLIAEGMVEHNGKMTGSSRWRRRRG